MGDGDPESLRCLAGEGTTTGIDNRSGNHDRYAHTGTVEKLFNRKESRLAVQRIKDGFNKQQVNATLHKPLKLQGVVLNHLFEGNRPETGIVDIRRERQRLAGRANGASHKARLVGGSRTILIRRPSSQAGRLNIQLLYQFRGIVVSL